MIAFLASTTGRMVRVAIGLALIAIGFAVGGTAGLVLMIVGLIPITTGSIDVCLLAAFAGLPVRGAALRKALQDQAFPKKALQAP